MEWSTLLASFFGAALGAIVSLTNERLRAAINRDTWLAQERWKLRADTYSTILKLLNRETEGLESVERIVLRLRTLHTVRLSRGSVSQGGV